jgi:hypothetical protein
VQDGHLEEDLPGGAYPQKRCVCRKPRGKEFGRVTVGQSKEKCVKGVDEAANEGMEPCQCPEENTASRASPCERCVCREAGTSINLGTIGAEGNWPGGQRNRETRI